MEDKSKLVTVEDLAHVLELVGTLKQMLEITQQSFERQLDIVNDGLQKQIKIVAEMASSKQPSHILAAPELSSENLKELHKTALGETISGKED